MMYALCVHHRYAGSQTYLRCTHYKHIDSTGIVAHLKAHLKVVKVNEHPWKTGRTSDSW